MEQKSTLEFKLIEKNAIIEPEKNYILIAKEEQYKVSDSVVCDVNKETTKKQNLINIYRPIGVSAVGSRRGDLPRGCDIKLLAVNPKFINSPWFNSSITYDDDIQNEKFKSLLF